MSKKLKNELEDLFKRINDIELDVTDAEEFTHITSDAFDALQTQITDLKDMLEELLDVKRTKADKSRDNSVYT